MTQGSSKLKFNRISKSTNSAKFRKQLNKSKQTKKGGSIVLPKNSFREEEILDRKLSRAIDKASEQKVAAKLIQDGCRLSLGDIMSQGKELNRERKRSIVKRKVGKVEEKLNQLKESVEQES